MRLPRKERAPCREIPGNFLRLPVNQNTNLKKLTKWLTKFLTNAWLAVLASTNARWAPSVPATSTPLMPIPALTAAPAPAYALKKQSLRPNKTGKTIKPGLRAPDNRKGVAGNRNAFSHSFRNPLGSCPDRIARMGKIRKNWLSLPLVRQVCRLGVLFICPCWKGAGTRKKQFYTIWSRTSLKWKCKTW